MIASFYFNETWTDLRKDIKYQILYKSIQWESSCPTRAEERTDMTKQIAAFCNFARARKNYGKIHNDKTRKTEYVLRTLQIDN
jgi:hypothetical protein